MKIEAVSVCVNYAEFLNAVVPHNMNLLERWVIVTSPTDRKTQLVCKKYGLQCLISDDHLRDGSFNKGRLVERGLHHLSADSWRLHIDADICLPVQFHKMLEQAHLQEDTIYGVDRVMVETWAHWQKLLASGWLYGKTKRYPYAVSLPDGFTIGDRWASHEAGYVPIGFFQLWHNSQDEDGGVRVKSYPQNHGTACRTDVQHSLQWDRKKRELIPELLVAHLGTPGKNWNGRQTGSFGPALEFADEKSPT